MIRQFRSRSRREQSVEWRVYLEKSGGILDPSPEARILQNEALSVDAQIGGKATLQAFIAIYAECIRLFQAGITLSSWPDGEIWYADIGNEQICRLPWLEC
jgi:hypothetical protein